MGTSCCAQRDDRSKITKEAKSSNVKETPRETTDGHIPTSNTKEQAKS